MSIRAFRRLTRTQRRAFIDTITDPLTRRVFEIAFLGPGKVSWQKAALLYGGGISPETLRVWVWRELHRASAPAERQTAASHLNIKSPAQSLAATRACKS